MTGEPNECIKGLIISNRYSKNKSSDIVNELERHRVGVSDAFACSRLGCAAIFAGSSQDYHGSCQAEKEKAVLRPWEAIILGSER